MENNMKESNTNNKKHELTFAEAFKLDSWRILAQNQVIGGENDQPSEPLTEDFDLKYGDILREILTPFKPCQSNRLNEYNIVKKASHIIRRRDWQFRQVEKRNPLYVKQIKY